MIRHLLALIGAVLVVGTLGDSICRAQAFVGHMTPAAVARGKTTRVTLHGAELASAIDLWTSLPGGKLQAKRVAESSVDRATFDVTIAADGQLGLHGLRLATDDGLSNAIIFLVDDLVPQLVTPTETSTASAPSIVLETRPQPLAVTLPTALAGTLRPAQLDRFAIDVTAGQTVAFECVSSRFGKDADPLIRIRDAQGRLIVERDNDPGLFFDFRFEQTFATAGRYTVELCDSRFHGDREWAYVLRMGAFPAVRVALPSIAQAGQAVALKFPEQPQLELSAKVAPDASLGRFYQEIRRPGDAAASWLSMSVSPYGSVVESEPNDTLEQATPATAPAVLCGVLGRQNDVDYFALDLKKGQRLVLTAETTVLDSPADVELAVIGPDGKEMQRVDDVLTEEATLTLNVNRDGVFKVLVHDVSRGGGPAYAYRVEVRPAGPQISLLADFADLTIPQGDYQSLPLILTRTEYKGPVKLSLVGAPAGVTLEPDSFAEGQDKLLARIKASSAAPIGLATLQVLATAEIDDVRLSAVARVAPLIDRQLHNVDLIKYALRECQKRLPPTLSNRIALQITPPAPFTIETPDTVVSLVRFLSAEFPIHSTRQPGFVAPLSFKAKGGQLGEESEIRRQVFTRFSPATAGQLIAKGTFYSRNLPQDAKDRVDLSATGESAERRVTLVRSFELDLKPGFDVTAEPASVSLLPGESVKLRLLANRTAPFTGKVTIEPIETPGITFPTTIEIPAGKDSVEVELKVAADFMPRKLRIRLPSQGTVGMFLEEPRPKDFEVDVKKPDTKPAK